MTITPMSGNTREFEYLCVDDFVSDIFSAQALATALEIGFIDRLIQNNFVSLQSLTGPDCSHTRGMVLLVNLLTACGVLENRDGTLEMSETFRKALAYRDLLELKLSLANFAAHDFLNYFGDMVCSPERLLSEASFCRWFSYDRCFEASTENIELTKRWMLITTTLTKYEAQACIKYHDFSGYRRVLDIGGNSGEFVLRLCREHAALSATVFDLPLVCDIGRQHIQLEPEASRIAFMSGNALTDTLPTGCDLITFKSMLHDWPDMQAAHFLSRASQSLAHGGTLLIFERGPMENDEAAHSYASIPMLLFYHSFRSPLFYQQQLENLDFRDITTRELHLDTPFFIVTAKK